MNISAILPLVHRSGSLFRFLASCLLVVVVFISLLLLTLRYWLLPDIEHYRNDIASAISQAAGQRVTIDSISANWDGIHPHLVLRKVQVYDKEDNPALLLNKLESTPSWRSLLVGELRFREIKIFQPNLVVHRDAEGVLYVAGISLDKEQTASQNGFLNWLLYQRHVDVINAHILWQDEKRGAPLLELKAVRLHLENSDSRHRFGLRATPPTELASPLDIRGDFTGEILNLPEQWYGKLFIKLNYADIAAWRSWFPPSKKTEIEHGTGALQMWINIDKGEMKRLIADVHLENVKTRLSHELPELDLAVLQGRVGWKKINSNKGNGFELFAYQLSAAIHGEHILLPTDFLLQAVWSHDGEPSGGKLSINGLDLGILGDLIDYFPLDGSLRERLNGLSPRGKINNMQAKWDGAWLTPAHLKVKGKFFNIGMNRYEAMPAFSGFSGNIDISEKGGTLNINSQNVSLDLPEIFHESLLLDTFTGQASWKTLADKNSIEIKFGNISFANNHASGGVHGTYHTEHNGPGEIDLIGYLTHADARYVGHYLPKNVGKLTREWVGKSIVAGEVSDLRLRLKGRLAAFPFKNNDGGIFQVSMQGTGGVLDYVPGWPMIEDISANLLFKGSYMEINASQANTFDTRLSKVKVQISDMMASDVRLQIKGMATGPTKQFMKFVSKYVVGGHTPYTIESIDALGNGDLLLDFSMPLPYSPGDNKFAGSYQFNDNQFNLGLELPYLEKIIVKNIVNLEQVNGVLTFTDSNIDTEKIYAQILGGPVTISSTIPSSGGIQLTAVGKANLDNLNRPTGSTQLQKKYLHGSTDWSAVFKIHDNLTDISIESSLQGIASDLPEPFSKGADDIVPLRLEKKALSLRQDAINLSYGKLVSAKIVRSQNDTGKNYYFRGILGFSAESLMLPDDGVLLVGSLPKLELDRWRDLFKQYKLPKGSNEGGGFYSDLKGIDLHIGILDFFGRRFSDMTFDADMNNKEWHATVSSKEIEGKVNWYPHDEGKVLARLKKLIVPSVVTVAHPTEPSMEKNQEKEELSALDVVADKLIISEKQLGKLELIASRRGQNWQIEKLDISNQDSSFIADGIWQNQPLSPRVQMNIKLEVNDIDMFLTRLGYPDRVKRGSGKLEGTLSWLGKPQSIDYPTLSGEINVQAKKGQFPKFKLGIGKLFGIFDIQALPRRVRLDFRDVFGDGFGFDKLNGRTSIAHGIAATEDLSIEGPAAEVEIKGKTNLYTETYNLHVTVIPSLGLATPVVDIATMIVNKKQKGSITSNEYNITGTWGGPIVTRIH